MQERSFRKKDWVVHAIQHKTAAGFIKKHHYLSGCGNTSSFCFGLFRKNSPIDLMGVSIWVIPSSSLALKYSAIGGYNDVLSLSRFCLSPNAQITNAASFLLGGSIKRIKKTKRFNMLVTYADTSEGHSGVIYRATNWVYDGTVNGKAKWIHKTDGYYLSNRRYQLRDNYEWSFFQKVPRSKKHRFYYRLHDKIHSLEGSDPSLLDWMM